MPLLDLVAHQCVQAVCDLEMLRRATIMPLNDAVTTVLVDPQQTQRSHAGRCGSAVLPCCLELSGDGEALVLRSDLRYTRNAFIDPQS